MFLLSIRTKPQHRDFEATEDAVRTAAIHALMKAGSRCVSLPDCIHTEVRTVLKRELMKGQVEVHIFTSAPDWLVLSIDNKLERFMKSMKGELRYLKEGDLSVFVTDSRHYSA